MKHLWLNITELTNKMNIYFKKDINELKLIYYKLGPILESFFILYKVMYEDDVINN